MIEKLNAMSDDDLRTVWRSLANSYWRSDEMFTDTISMNDWAQNVYAEMCRRNLPR